MKRTMLVQWESKVVQWELEHDTGVLQDGASGDIKEMLVEGLRQLIEDLIDEHAVDVELLGIW